MDSRNKKSVKWHKGIVEAEIEVWERQLHGSELRLLRQPCSSHWLKWINKRFRGGVESLVVAKAQLEREAAGEGSAWGIK